MKLRIVNKKSDSYAAVKLAVEEYKAAFEWCQRKLVDRRAETESLMLCVLAGEHLLLEGKHGLAKSMLAGLFFETLSGAKVFSIQLMEGTQADELLGPLESETYRKKAIWRRNTEGMLPTCDFAQLDEVYRASDMLLPSMMTILNERRFRNGHETTVCPLNTAVATANFITENPELDAIHDRWLVRVRVQPVSTSFGILRMLSEYLEDAAGPRPTLRMQTIRTLQQVERKITVTESVCNLYINLVTAYRKNLPSYYISDRRLCKAIRLARASYLLDAPGAAVAGEPMPAAYLVATGNALAVANDSASQAAFAAAWEQTVGYSIRCEREDMEMETLVRGGETILAGFDSSLSRKKAGEMLRNTMRFLAGLDAIPHDRQPTQQRHVEAITKLRIDMESLKNTLSGALNEPTDREMKNVLEGKESAPKEQEAPEEEVPF